MTTITETPTSGRTRPSTSSMLGRAVTDIGAMVGRELRRTVRSIDAMATSFAIPVVIMIVFVVVFGGAIEPNGDYVNYVVPGTLILCVGFGSASTAIAVAQDMATGTINRFKTLPIFGPSVLFGHVVSSLVRNLAVSAVVVSVAFLLGFRAETTVGGWLLTAGILALVIFTFTWISVVAGLLLSVDAAGSVNFIFLFLPYISSGFVPTDTMPAWLAGFAEHQPYTPIIESVRSAMTGQPIGSNGWVAALWLCGLLLFGLVAALVLYRRRTAR